MELFEGQNKESKDIISFGMACAAAASPSGILLPTVDTAAMVLIWGKMICSLGRVHNVEVGKEEWIKVATICGKGILAYNIGGKVITWIVNCLCLGTTSVATMLINAALNAAATYSIGVAFDKMLNEEDLNGKTIQEMAKIGLSYMAPPGTGVLYAIVLWVRDWAMKEKKQQILDESLSRHSRMIPGASMNDGCLDDCLYIHKNGCPVGIGTVRQRGEGWSVALMLGVQVTPDAWFENAIVSHNGLSVNINSLDPIVYQAGGEIAVVVSYNNFGDGKLYCRRR